MFSGRRQRLSSVFCWNFHNFYRRGFTAADVYVIIGKDSMKMGECFHEYADSQDENRLHDGPEPV